MVSTLTLHRLAKEEAQLEKQPLDNAFIQRQQILNFYFCLYNLEGSYAGGFYFGLLELNQKYPFNAPKLIFYTPSGRFDTNLPICTSFTNYHQQTWTSAWNVRTLILATISFMYSEQPSYGCCHMTSEQRVQMAKQSLKFNMQNETFVRLFSQKLKKMRLLSSLMIKEIGCNIQLLSTQEQPNSNLVAGQQDLKQARYIPQIPQIKQQAQQSPLKKQQQLEFGLGRQDDFEKRKRQGWIRNKLTIVYIIGGVIGAVITGWKLFKYFKGK